MSSNSTPMGLWSSLNNEDVPISPNRRANSWLKAAVNLSHQEADLLLKIHNITRRKLAAKESMKVHSRDVQIYKGELDKVNAEASSLTASSGMNFDCVRLQGKWDAFFPLYKAAAEKCAMLKLSLKDDEDELKLLRRLLAFLQVSLAKLIDSLKNHFKVFGPISTDFVEGAVFICTCELTKEIVVDIPRFWTLRNEIVSMAKKYGRILVVKTEK